MSTMIDKPDPGLAARLRAERERRGWSLADLAGRSGVSRAMISKLERAESSPTAALLGRLAAAFGLTLSQLLRRVERDAESGAEVRVSRAGTQPRWQDPATGFLRRALTPAGDAALLELVWGELPGGAEIAYPAAVYRPIADQQIVVLEGRLAFTEGAVTHLLAPGDCLRLGAPEDCVFRNPERLLCRYIVAVLRASR